MADIIASLKHIKIGLTVFAGIVIFIVFMFIIGSEESTFTPTYTLKLFLPNINGLVNGSMVSLGGLKVGNVSSLDFGERDGQHGVIISSKIRTHYQPQITTGSAATVRTIGMLGDKFVDISIGAGGERQLEDGEFITVKPSVELGDVLEHFTGVINDVAATAANVRAISDTVRNGRGAAGRLFMDENVANEVSGIAEKLHRIASSLSERRSTLGKLIQDDELYAKLDRSAQNLSAITDSLRMGKGTAGRLLMNDSLSSALLSISARMDAVLARMASDSSSVGPFLNSTATYRRIEELMTNINALIEDIRENPKRYVHLSLF